MRIGIVGNCQSGVMAQWLRIMLPEHEIAYHSIAQPFDTYGPAGDDLLKCDIVISQPIGPGHGPLETELLREAGPFFVLVPNLVFTGFQPDMAYLHYHNGGGGVVSPVGAYHSRLIATCFHLGLGPIRTRKMFNSYVFEILGYFDEYEKARLNFEQAVAEQELPFDLDALFESGVFMHTANHANILANRLMAEAAARRAGLELLADIDEIADEMLEDTVWPVYPEIAGRIGIDGGNMHFTRAAHLASDAGARQITLEQMIEKSFDTYARDEARIDFSPVYRDAEILRSALKRKYLLPSGSTRPLLRTQPAR